MNIKVGSRWSGNDDKEFIVIHVVEQEGHTWIHYRDNYGNNNNEYSCFAESFLLRFRQLPE